MLPPVLQRNPAAIEWQGGQAGECGDIEIQLMLFSQAKS